ncbi:MAG: amidohydrolase [Chloroflexi bacterium]|nr:amidohydrolase [Chloroflexota bacterium]
MAAELILHNANVLTLDDALPRAQLVAVSGDRVLSVGGADDLGDLSGPSSRVIDCAGKTLIPGFIDAHCHIFAFAASLLSIDCRPGAVASIEDIKAAVRRKAQQTPPGAWIRCTGYDEFHLSEKRHPTRHDLDEAAPDYPVKLTHRSTHACVLNSLALSMAGITRETPDPTGGFIDRDDAGEPTGLLFEMEDYLARHVGPTCGAEEMRQGLRLADQRYLSLGITSLQDATHTNDLAQRAAFRELKQRGDLSPRLWMMAGIGGLSEFQREGLGFGSGDDQMRLGAAKIVLDETTGVLLPPQAELNELVLAAHRAGWQVAIHAIEEKAVQAAAAALENAQAQGPERGHRHRVEHCSVCPPPLVERLHKIDAVVVSQPPFLYYSGERYAAQVPDAQFRWLYRFGSFLKAGLKPAASSDSPVVPNNPLMGVCAAVTRRAATGRVINGEEAVSPLEALRMYTSAGAYAAFEEGEKGSISPGKLADLVLLSHDPAEVAAEEIKDITVEMTIIGGKVVWS